MRWHRRVDMGGPPEFNPRVTPDKEAAERLAERLRAAMERLEKEEERRQLSARKVSPIAHVDLSTPSVASPGRKPPSRPGPRLEIRS